MRPCYRSPRGACPAAVENPSGAARTGVFWGLGHGIGVVIIGGIGLALPTHEAIPCLLAYLVASVVAMGVFAYGIGTLAGRSGIVWIRRLMYGSGVLAVAVGVFSVVSTWPS